MTHDNLPILSRDQNCAISLRRAEQLINITDKILASSRQKLATLDEGWMERLWAWADYNGVPDLEWVEVKNHVKGGFWRGLPRMRPALLEFKILDIGGYNLTTLPPEIGQLTQLEHLNVWANELTSLPPEIGQLDQLKYLDIGGNELSTLPLEILQLKQLQELWVGESNLTTLPSEIGQLKQLSLFWIGGNNLTTLPTEIAQLTSIEWLGIDYNCLHLLPSDMLLNDDIMIYYTIEDAYSMEVRLRVASEKQFSFLF